MRLWAHCLAHKKIQIFCDNLAVVNALNSDHIQDDSLMACACTPWAIAAEYDITLVYKHSNDMNNDMLTAWPDGPREQITT